MHIWVLEKKMKAKTERLLWNICTHVLGWRARWWWHVVSCSSQIHQQQPPIPNDFGTCFDINLFIFPVSSFFFSRIASAAGCWACSERCSGECVGSKSIQLWIVYKLFEIGVKTRQHWFWFPSVFRSVLRAEVIHDNVQCNMFEAVVRNVAVFDTDFLYNCIFSIC